VKDDLGRVGAYSTSWGGGTLKALGPVPDNAFADSSNVKRVYNAAAATSMAVIRMGGNW
jgi:hypothetical protein